MRTCQASTVVCTRPTASASASLCAHHVALLAAGRWRTIAEAEAEASVSTKTGRARMVKGLPTIESWG